MKYLLNPKLFIIINLIPVVILSIILYNDFYIIKPVLTKSQINLWVNFASLLLISFLINVFYIFDKIHKKIEIGFNFIILNIAFNAFFIYFTSNYSNKIIPSDIPSWMLTTDPIFEIYNLLLPTIVFCLCVFSSKTIDFYSKMKNSKHFIFSITIPILLFLTFNFYGFLIFENFYNDIDQHIIYLFFILFALMYGYLILNAIIYFIKKKQENSAEYLLYLKLAFSFLLPIVGLILFTEILNDGKQFWVVFLVVLNGVIILIPSFGSKYIRLIIFFLRTLIFPISIYFFLIFLPWLPFVPILMIVFGLGFVFISPIFSFLLHLDEWYTDFDYLKEVFNNYSLKLVIAGAFLIIPLVIHFEFNKDKENIVQILDYVYNPDYNKRYKFDNEKVAKTIESIRTNKSRSGQSFFYNDLPYISNYYNWLVFDNLTLSNNKIDKIESIFLDNGNSSNINNSFNRNPSSNNVEITKTNMRSTFNETYKYWESWVDFEITNKSNNSMSEFVTNFKLPMGSYISDYYLYIGNKKEMGQLAEKKSAIWIYSNITSVNRDPGMINYISKDKINFRVFPFAINEKRRTGIKFIHKDMIILDLDSNKIQLGNKTESNKIIENNNYIFIPAEAKKNLESTERKFYFHFIIDASKYSISPSIVSKIEKIFEKYPSIKNSSKFTLVGSTLKTFNYDYQWKSKIYEHNNNGGFYLERAFNYFLINNYKYNLNYYHKFIVVSDDLSKAILDTDFNNIDFAYPENDLFFYINNNYEIESYSFTNKQISKDSISIDLFKKEKVILYILKDKSKKYIADNSQNTLLPILNNENIDINLMSNKWEHGNLLKTNYLKLLLNPQLNDKYWSKLVNTSFQSRILSDYTSYIVLENEAQRRLLKKKQKEALSGKLALDLGEETLNMSEPNSYLILIVLILALIVYKHKFILQLFKVK